jgi:hypothetical protein
MAWCFAACDDRKTVAMEQVLKRNAAHGRVTFSELRGACEDTSTLKKLLQNLPNCSATATP